MQFFTLSVFQLREQLLEKEIRADGEALGLSLTVTPGQPGYAAMQSNFSGHWWNLWLSLLQYAGY